MVQAEAVQKGKAEGSAMTQKRPSSPSSSPGFLSQRMIIAAQLAKMSLVIRRERSWDYFIFFWFAFLKCLICPTSFLSRKLFELFVSGFFTDLRVSAINSLRAFWSSEIWSLTLCSGDSGHSSLTLYGMKSESYFEKSDFSKLGKNKTSNLNATECSLSYLNG